MTDSTATPERAPLDLLVKGGTVVDPSAALEAPLDIGIRDGRIADLQPSIPADAAAETIDASGSLVVPGLIDLHTHVYPGGTYWGIEPEPIAATSGVSTWVDAGTAGAFNFGSFVELVARRSRPRVLAYLNISAIGLVAHDYELSNLELCDVELTRRTVERHRQLIVGIKARMGTPTIGENGLEPLRRAREVASDAGLPLMVHIAVSPPPIDDVLALMRPGDILTHCCTGQTMRIVDEDGRLSEAAADARERGIVMDLGHGAGSFSFQTAEQLAAHGFWPDVISSDLHQLSQYSDAAKFEEGKLVVRVTSLEPRLDLPTCMSKLLGLGMPFTEVLRATTETPARVLGRLGEIGTLQPGAAADVALLRIDGGPFLAHDSEAATRAFDQRITSTLTICQGVPLSPAAASEPPVWIEPVGRAAGTGLVRQS